MSTICLLTYAIRNKSILAKTYLFVNPRHMHLRVTFPCAVADGIICI